MPAGATPKPAGWQTVRMGTACKQPLSMNQKALLRRRHTAVRFMLYWEMVGVWDSGIVLCTGVNDPDFYTCGDGNATASSKRTHLELQMHSIAASI